VALLLFAIAIRDALSNMSTSRFELTLVRLKIAFMNTKKEPPSTNDFPAATIA